MKKLICFIVCSFIAVDSFATEHVFDTSVFKPESYITEASLLGTRMNDEQFMRFAFLYSEIPQELVPVYMQKYNTLVATLFAKLANTPLSDYEKGEYILHFLHKNLFKSYREFVTDLDSLFDKGLYNCVSSSIVYYALAMRFELPVSGIKTSDHAFCALDFGGKITDVETTSLYGFNPGEKKEFANSFGQTGFVYTPPANYQDRRSIGKLDLLSLILQNRIVELYKIQNYEKIVRLAINIHFLLQTKDSYTNLISEIGNYSSYMSNKKRFKEALNFLYIAVQQYGEDAKLSEYAGVLFNNGLAAILASSNIEHIKEKLPEAEAFFADYRKTNIIPFPIIADTQSVLDEARIRVFIEERELSVAVSEIKKFYAESRIEKKRYNDLLMYVYSRDINTLMRQKNWELSLRLAQKTMSDTINDSRATKQLETVEYNIGAQYHNTFAALYNAKKYSEAQKVIEEGLQLVPNNTHLLNDKKRIEALQRN